MSATSPVSRSERVVRAAVTSAVLRAASSVVRGGPVRDTAVAGTPAELRAAALLHLGVVVALAGAASTIALVFFVVPPGLFVAAFGALTAVLVGLGVRALRGGRVVAGRGWLFWAGIGWGLLVFSAAYLTGLTGFVPHLLLVWAVGVVVLGVLAAGAVQTAFAGILTCLWVGAAALVGESLLPGVVVLAVLLGFPILARPSRLVGAVAALLTLALALAFALRHLGGAPAAPLAVVTTVAGCDLLRVLAARLPVDATGAPPDGCPGRGIAAVTTVLGIIALIAVPLPPVLGMLRGQVANSAYPVAILLPIGILLVVAALPGRRRPGSTVPIAVFAAGSIALAGMLLLPQPSPVIITLAVALAAMGYGAWQLLAGTRDTRWHGLGWLAAGVLVAGMGRPGLVVAALLLIAGGYVALLGWRGVRAEAAPR
jgi:hypothetical protein